MQTLAVEAGIGIIISHNLRIVHNYVTALWLCMLVNVLESTVEDLLMIRIILIVVLLMSLPKWHGELKAIKKDNRQICMNYLVDVL